MNSLGIGKLVVVLASVEVDQGDRMGSPKCGRSARSCAAPGIEVLHALLESTSFPRVFVVPYSFLMLPRERLIPLGFLQNP